jgi:hypothetical protein
MYAFGGHDKDMYYNDIWRYVIPTFASDRSKWYELITLWERDIPWLDFHNNRYNHEILKDVYEQVCKDAFDSETMESRSRTWQFGHDAEVSDPRGRYFKTKREDLAPVAGGNPLDLVQMGTQKRGVPQQGWEPTSSIHGSHENPPDPGWVAKGNWVCEEIKMRYDFLKVDNVYLKQDLVRPSSRYGAGLKLIYSDINSSLVNGPGIGKEAPNGRQDYVGRVKTCEFTSWDIYYPKVTGIDRRTHWEVPPGCRFSHLTTVYMLTNSDVQTATVMVKQDCSHPSLQAPCLQCLSTFVCVD